MTLGLNARHTYVSGCVRYHDLAYTASQDDAVPADVEHSHFHEIDGNNLGYIGAVTWATASMTVSKFPQEQMIAMSAHGEVKLFGSGKQSDEQITTPDGSPETRGLLRKLRTIENRTYAVGMGRQVYRRENEDDWRCLDQKIRPAIGEVKGFESIDGFSSSDIYAVGWDGEIWHFDGQDWEQKSSPTHVVLTNVLCAGDGNVYIAARQGLLIRGRGDSWESIEHESMDEDIWDLAWYGEALYLSPYRGLFKLVGDKLVPVDFGTDKAWTTYHLSAADGVLWSFGKKDVMAFDGQTWTRID